MPRRKKEEFRVAYAIRFTMDADTTTNIWDAIGKDYPTFRDYEATWHKSPTGEIIITFANTATVRAYEHTGAVAAFWTKYANKYGAYKDTLTIEDYWPAEQNIYQP